MRTYHFARRFAVAESSLYIPVNNTNNRGTVPHNEVHAISPRIGGSS